MVTHLGLILVQVHSLAHGCYGYAYGLVESLKTLDIYIKLVSLIIIGGITY